MPRQERQQATGSREEQPRPARTRAPGKPDRKAPTTAIPMAEWICAALGLALVGGTIGYLTHQIVNGSASPPDVQIRIEAVAPVHGGHVVTIAASNEGTRTAAEVKIHGELRNGADVVETSEMTFAYLPARSERKGGLFFMRDPAGLEVRVTAKGYEEP